MSLGRKFAEACLSVYKCCIARMREAEERIYEDPLAYDGRPHSDPMVTEEDLVMAGGMVAPLCMLLQSAVPPNCKLVYTIERGRLTVSMHRDGEDISPDHLACHDTGGHVLHLIRKADPEAVYRIGEGDFFGDGLFAIAPGAKTNMVALNEPEEPGTFSLPVITVYSDELQRMALGTVAAEGVAEGPVREQAIIRYITDRGTLYARRHVLPSNETELQPAAWRQQLQP